MCREPVNPSIQRQRVCMISWRKIQIDDNALRYPTHNYNSQEDYLLVYKYS